MERLKEEEHGIRWLFAYAMLPLTFQSVFWPFSSPLTPPPLNKQTKIKTLRTLSRLGSTRRPRETRFQIPTAAPAQSLLSARSPPPRDVPCGANQSRAQIIPSAAIRPMGVLGVGRSSDEQRWLRPCTTGSSC